MDFDAVKNFLSPLLGLGITVGALFLQAPQIYVCITKRSVEGLAPMSIYASSMSPLLFCLYCIRKGNEIHTWAENLILLVQNIILVVLLWIYSRPPIPRSTMFSVCAAFPIVISVYFSIPESYLFILPLLNIPILLTARLPQLYSNWKGGGTGTLSPIPLVLVAVGALVRIFTTIQSIGMDWSVISSYMWSSGLAGLTLVQWLYYNVFNGNTKSNAQEEPPVSYRTRSASKKKKKTS